MRPERVLLVDDEIDFVAALAERFRTRGITVVSASDGPEAVTRVREERFDAVILDLAMPGMDGIETLRELRKLQPDLQVILLTGRATTQKSVEAMKLGAMDFLEKPADIGVLLERIHQAREKADELTEQRTQDMIDDILKTKGW